MSLGGAGSIGQAVTKEIFKREPKKIHVVDISENNMVELVRDICYQFETVIAPSAIVSEYAELGYGVLVMDGAIINTGTIVEHDCNIGAHNHIAQGSCVKWSGYYF